MLGVLVLIVLNYGLLWLVQRQHITALGIVPNGLRVKLLFGGMVVMAFFCCINLLGQAYMADVRYVRNPSFGWSSALFATWWTFKAALFEELIFRGAILHIALRKIGIWKACLMSAIAFGIYHWFSYEMFDRGVIPMIYVFLLTGAAGYMFAYAYARSGSIWAPFGLHFGWIVVSIVFLSSGPLGESMFVPDGEGSPVSGWGELAFFLWQTVAVPGLVLWYYVKRVPQMKMEPLR